MQEAQQCLVWYEPATDIICSRQNMPAIVSTKKHGKTCSGDTHQLQATSRHIDVSARLSMTACMHGLKAKHGTIGLA